MPSPAQDRITKLLQSTRPRLFSAHTVEFKNCFGAVAGYVNGNIFVSCGKFGIALKLSPKTIDGLLKERGVKHLKYFPKGRVKKDYVVLPKRILDDRDRIKKLVDASLRFALK